MRQVADALHSTIWLLDGSIYFFRGYFGMPDTVVDASGESCGGVHGFASALLAVLQRHGPADGLVAFDKSLGSCFRNDIYPGYKANRALPDENIIYQFGLCQRLCELVGVGWVGDTRFEADDLLATAVKKSRNNSIIYSKDKDLRQLVSAKCKLQDLLGDKVHDLPWFRAAYGFEPGLFPDYQALVGDTSDNVPGIAGFGAKKAGRLIAQYGALEEVVASRPRWSGDKVGVPSEGKLATAPCRRGRPGALDARGVAVVGRRTVTTRRHEQGEPCNLQRSESSSTGCACGGLLSGYSGLGLFE